MKMLLATTAILSMAAVGTVANAAAAPAPAVATAMPNNVLLADWSGPYDGVPPWDKVDPKLFSPAFEYGIAEQRREIDAIANNPAAPTFENTIEAMEKAGQRFSRVENVFAVMTDNKSTPEYQALDKEWQPKISAAFDEINFNEKLFQRVKSLYDRKASLGLDAVQDRLLTRTYDGFIRSGANLNAAQKAQLASMNQELATLFSTFNEKLLADEGTYITATAAELKGVPDDVKVALAGAAKDRKLPAGTYAMKNTRSVVDPVLTFADNRALREKVWTAFVNRGDNGDANDTNATDRQDPEAARRAREAARLQDPRPLADAGHDGQDPAKAMDLMMRVWTAGGRPREGRGRRHAGDCRQARRQDHHRAVGLPLLRGEGPQAEVRPRPERDQAVLRSSTSSSTACSGRRASSTASASRRSRADPGLRPGRPHV